MNDLEFWQLIEKIDGRALHSGREDEAIAPLLDALADLQEPELFAYEEALSRQLYALDGERYASQAGDSRGSDDGFLYARCYVVGCGRTYFEAVLADPAKMPTSLGQWFEPLLYAHREAWSELTGRDQSEWPYLSTVSYETGSNKNQWDA
jgi:hypothetical protein